MVKKWSLLVGCLSFMILLVACKYNINEFKKLYYEGKSVHWRIQLDVENDSERLYKISYIGSGKRPPIFNYEIYDEPGRNLVLNAGEGDLEKQEEFWISITCGGSCTPPLPSKIKSKIQWEGKTEELVMKQTKKPSNKIGN